MLKVRQLDVFYQRRQILKQVDFSLEKGKIYAIMGPNGSGKTTLARVIAGDRRYRRGEKSKIIFAGKNITAWPAEQISQAGIFITFQNPPALENINLYEMMQFLQPHQPSLVLYHRLEILSRALNLNPDFLKRPINDGFSGGERKKFEVLQAIALNPKLIIFDEIDSGLDVDALRLVAHFLRQEQKGKTYLFISHHQQIFKYLPPVKVFIINQGQITQEGSASLLKKIAENGFGYDE